MGCSFAPRHGEGNGEKNDCGCHAEQGTRMAEPVLVAACFSPEKVEQITYCVAAHRFSKGLMPKTQEARVLQDTDRLDALSTIAIAHGCFITMDITPSGSRRVAFA